MLQKFLEGLRTQRKGVLRAMVLEGLGLNPGVVLALRNVKQFFGGLSWRLGRAALRRLPLLPWTSFAKECGVGKSAEWSSLLFGVGGMGGSPSILFY